MALKDFIQFERHQGDQTRVHLLHTQDPRFVMEVVPVYDSSGRRIEGGVIKRVCMQNCPYGGYQRYNRLISEAQIFFDRTLAEPASPFDGRIQSA